MHGQSSPVAASLIGLVSGLISAVVLVAALSGGALLSVFLLLATPLPLMIAGLGWGLISCAIATTTAGLALMALLRLEIGLGHVFVFGVPSLVLTHIAYFHLAGRTESSDGSGWYPPGRLLATIAFLGGAAPLALAPLLGGSYRVLQKPINDAMTVMKNRFGNELGLNKLTAEELSALSRVMADLTPSVIACYLVIIYAANLYIAGRVTRASGMLLRPWPDLPGLTYPAGMALALFAAIALTMVPGLPQLIGVCFSGALLMAFFLAGLAVLHAMADGQRPGRLSALYAAFFTILGPYVMLIVAALGLAEPLLRLRDKFPRAPRPPAGTA